MAITLQVHLPDGPLRRFMVQYPGDWLLWAPLPLIVVLHDANDTAEGAASSMNFGEYNSDLESPVDALGVPFPFHKCVVVYPEAFRPAEDAVWNVGHDRDGGALFNLDDVHFVQRAVAWVIDRFENARTEFTSRGSHPLADQGGEQPRADLPQIDPRRLFVVGHGSGGAMVYRLLTQPFPEAGRAWRAAAVVNGTAGGLRHARLLLDYGIGWGDAGDPRLVRHVPTAGVPPASLFVLRGALDQDWGSAVPPNLGEALAPPVLAAGGISRSDLDALLATGLDDREANRQVRWDLGLEASVDPWAAELGIEPPWSEPVWERGSPLYPGVRVRVEVESDADHAWVGDYRDRILLFFGGLG